MSVKCRQKPNNNGAIEISAQCERVSADMTGLRLSKTAPYSKLLAIILDISRLHAKSNEAEFNSNPPHSGKRPFANKSDLLQQLAVIPMLE